MRATVRPLAPSPHSPHRPATLIGRVKSSAGHGDKVKVQYRNGDVRAVERFQVYDETDQRQLSKAEIDSLPWQGNKSAKDPAGQGNLLDQSVRA
jgi:hypothetical protein